MSSRDAVGNGGNRWIRRERGVGDKGWTSRWVGADGEEVANLFIRMANCSRWTRTYLWRADTLEERPPKEDAIVLNSTCLISGLAFKFDGSL